MATIRWNITANFFGGVWTAALTLLIIPFQVKILGMEAFGLVGLIATLQVIFNVLDLGLSATITRSVAADTTNNHEQSREIVQTAATLYWMIALVIVGMLGFQAGWIADKWLKLNTLSPDIVKLGIQIIALSLALRWPVTLYAGLITGLKRLEILNFLKSTIITFKLLGGLLVLVIFRDLVLFLIWTAFAAFFEITAYIMTCRRLLPGLSLRPFLSYKAVKEVWRFSLGMNLIAILAMILTQTDRIILSKLISIELLGYYYLAYNTAIGIVLIQSAINNAMFPSFASDDAIANREQLVSRHKKATQITVYLASLPAFLLIFFGYDILSIWVNPKAAAGSYHAMAILAFGSLLNAAVSNFYTVATASGRPYMILKINILGVLLYIPGLFWLITLKGMIGAAMAWVFLNLYYIVSVIPAVQKGIIKESIVQWLKSNLLTFLIIGLSAFGGMRLLINMISYDQLSVALPACIVSTLIYIILGYHFLSQPVQSDIKSYLRSIFGITFVKSVN